MTCPPCSDLTFLWVNVVPDAGLVLERSLSTSAAANEDAANGPGRGNVRFLPSTTTRTKEKELNERQVTEELQRRAGIDNIRQ